MTQVVLDENNSEKCIITGKRYPDDEIVITFEGPVAAVLWGDVNIEFDEEGWGIMPPHVVELFVQANGRQPESG